MAVLPARAHPCFLYVCHSLLRERLERFLDELLVGPLANEGAHLLGTAALHARCTKGRPSECQGPAWPACRNNVINEDSTTSWGGFSAKESRPCPQVPRSPSANRMLKQSKAHSHLRGTVRPAAGAWMAEQGAARPPATRTVPPRGLGHSTAMAARPPASRAQAPAPTCSVAVRCSHARWRGGPSARRQVGGWGAAVAETTAPVRTRGRGGGGRG